MSRPRLRPLMNSLRVQLGLAFLLLVLVYAAGTLTVLQAFQRQLDYDRLVDIGGRLQLTAQQMHVQALNYKQNAPRDYPTYYRDLRLYYQDLNAQTALFDQIVAGFMDGVPAPPAWPGHLGNAAVGPGDAGDGAGQGADGGNHDGQEPPGDGADDATGLSADAAAAMRRMPLLQADTDPAVRSAIARLESTWAGFRAALFETIGEDPEEPRLEWAAEYVIEHHAALEQASAALTNTLRGWAEAEHRRMATLAWGLIAATALLALAVLVGLYDRALRPLQRTMAGFEQVAAGDFGHLVMVAGSTETRALAAGFNALSARLDLLFRLIEGLQRGQDLDQVVALIGRDFRDLLRCDWIGVVLVNADGATVRLEASSLDGTPETGAQQVFRLPDTLLAAVLAEGRPRHIAGMAEALANPHHEFLRALAGRGLQDAIFLPVTERSQTPVPAVVAFATRAAHQYDQAHLHFLGNIAQLITESFGRTVRLAERSRLAAIGGFAAGIAHELRSPLATLTMALDYFARQPLGSGGEKRLALAQGEAARMGRLVDDMLLYAKPLSLSLAPCDLTALVREAVALQQGQVPCAGRVLWVDALAGETPPGAPGPVEPVPVEPVSVEPVPIEQVEVNADRDRLLQVLTNLLRNACDAAPPDGLVQVGVAIDRTRGAARLSVHNGGEPIPPAVLARLGEPFVSARRGGTGLGLAVVQRLVSLHGGTLQFESTGATGTTATVWLPLA